MSKSAKFLGTYFGVSIAEMQKLLRNASWSYLELATVFFLLFTILILIMVLICMFLVQFDKVPVLKGTHS